jgi:pimeloyl-ACP methyl ester carboxylesterase
LAADRVDHLVALSVGHPATMRIGGFEQHEKSWCMTEGQMTRSSLNIAAPWRYERLEGPGHWMQLEAPDTINRLRIDFLPA